MKNHKYKKANEYSPKRQYSMRFENTNLYKKMAKNKTYFKKPVTQSANVINNKKKKKNFGKTQKESTSSTSDECYDKKNLFNLLKRIWKYIMSIGSNITCIEKLCEYFKRIWEYIEEYWGYLGDIWLFIERSRFFSRLINYISSWFL